MIPHDSAPEPAQPSTPRGSSEQSALLAQSSLLLQPDVMITAAGRSFGRFHLLPLWHGGTRLFRSLLAVEQDAAFDSFDQVTTPPALVPLMLGPGRIERVSLAQVATLVKVWLDVLQTELLLRERQMEPLSPPPAGAAGATARESAGERADPLRNDRLLLDAVERAYRELTSSERPADAIGRMHHAEASLPTTSVPENLLELAAIDEGAAMNPPAYKLLEGDTLWAAGPFAVYRVWLEWRDRAVRTPMQGIYILGQQLVSQAIRAVYDDGLEPPFVVATWWSNMAQEPAHYTNAIVAKGIRRELKQWRKEMGELRRDHPDGAGPAGRRESETLAPRTKRADLLQHRYDRVLRAVRRLQRQLDS